MAKDPFTQVYDALWTMIKSDVPLMAIIKAGNVIDFDGNRNPLKDNLNEADLPELMLEPAGGEGVPSASSTGAKSTQRFSLTITNRTLDVERFYAIKWRLFYLIAKNAPDNLGLDFVKIVRGFEDENGMQGVRRKLVWEARFVIEVDMWWAKSTFV